MLARIEDDNKEALKRRIEDEHPEWRLPRPMPKPIGHLLKEMIEEDEKLPIEDYAHDPWWIMRVQANAYRTAEASLTRNGFECYSPTFKIVEPTPLRMIPPKKRHQAALFKREIRQRRFKGYAFVRRMFGDYDVNRLFDLAGCGSIIRTVGSIALVPDFDVELLRLVEMDGSMDQVQVETYRGYKVSRLPENERQWTGTSKIVGRLDDREKTILYVERAGRIAQLISRADPG